MRMVRDKVIYNIAVRLTCYVAFAYLACNGINKEPRSYTNSHKSSKGSFHHLLTANIHE